MAKRICASTCVLTSLALGGTSLTAAASAKEPPGAGAALDPRSAAALNRDAARNPGKASPPMFADDPFTRRIHPLGVNDAAADTTAQDTQSGTSIAAVGADGVAVAWNDSGSFNANNHFTGSAYSTNGGLSFTDTGTLPNSVEGDSGGPVLATQTSTGDVFLATQGFSTGETIQVFRSINGGQSYESPANATGGAGSGDFQDKPWMTVDNFAGTGQNRIHLCWTRAPNGGGDAEIRLTSSSDNAATFTPGALLSTGGQGCFVAVGPDHSVYVFYYRGTGAGGQGDDNKLFVRRSTDLGATFAPEVQVADLSTTTINGNLTLNGGLRSHSFPHAAVNPVSGHVVVVFNDDPSPTSAVDNGDVYFTRSTDGGATWSARARINSNETARDQFFPTVAISPDGRRVMFGYYSRMHDPSNLVFHRRGRLATMSLASGSVTLNRGFQLSPNTPLALGQDTVIDSTYMGDYDQIAATSSAFLSSWSDNRAGNAFHANQPDVRFARIAVPPTSPDLGVSVTPSPASIGLGENTTFTVNVTGSGATASDVFVNVSRVTGLAIQSANVASGRCDTSVEFVGCSLGQIPAGSTKSIQIVATGAIAAATRTLTATVTTSSRDTNAANDSASANVVVATGSATGASFSTGDIATPIFDLATVDIPLTVASEGTALRVSPSVRLNHTFDADLDLFLISPTGKIVELSTDNGGAADNYGSGGNDCTGTRTRFDDDYTTSIVNGVAPFAGLFRPEQPLAAMVGEPTDGEWRLRIRDDEGGEVGTVGCFRLQFTRVP